MWYSCVLFSFCSQLQSKVFTCMFENVLNLLLYCDIHVFYFLFVHNFKVKSLPVFWKCLESSTLLWYSCALLSFCSQLQSKVFTCMLKKCLKSTACYILLEIMCFYSIIVALKSFYQAQTNWASLFWFYSIHLSQPLLWQFKYQVCSWFTALTEVSALYVLQNS